MNGKNSAEYVSIGTYKVHSILYKTVNHILPGTGVSEEHFWGSLVNIVEQFGKENRQLLDTRDELQRQIDAWYSRQTDHASEQFIQEQRKFLVSIGYIAVTNDPATVLTSHVDPEIAHVPGPQLVVPVDNPRFVLNAINARWGNLFTIAYNSDIFGGGPFDHAKGVEVVDWCFSKLDTFLPLQGASWKTIQSASVESTSGSESMQLIVKGGTRTTLVDATQFKGYNGTTDRCELLFCHHGLHIIVVVGVGAFAACNDAHISELLMESSLTAIMDFEDSVSTVDAEDKAAAYTNWAGLMKGTLEVSIVQEGNKMVRKMNSDRHFRGFGGESITLPGRVLALVRNVGIHMYSDAVLDAAGNAVPEGLLDIMITAVAALHDLRRNSTLCNSKYGSIYVVKPKMHGPREVDFVCRTFTQVEMHLGLPKNAIKIGIMDEERRTSLNLAECLRAAHDRCFFINTGFLDRTGDEIHTCMAAGPVLPKGDIKNAPWIAAYEKLNTLTGIQCNLLGRAQIGKGMWAEPDNMKVMLERKIAHPMAGANTAWVPSPIAGTLHALHYHLVDVHAVQKKLATEPFAGHSREELQRHLLTPPLLSEKERQSLLANPGAIAKELENNAQGILGYVVRWIYFGVGCSKVADLHGVGLMEDRATLRISAQHVGNWLKHKIISDELVVEKFRKMAEIVDQQNSKDSRYTPMHKDFDNNIAFQAALAMCRTATKQPNGYTETTLTEARKSMKMRAKSSL